MCWPGERRRRAVSRICIGIADTHGRERRRRAELVGSSVSNGQRNGNAWSKILAIEKSNGVQGSAFSLECDQRMGSETLILDAVK